MCPIFEFKCDECGDTVDRLTSHSTQIITCTCGGMMQKQFSVPIIQLDGTDPGFPGAYDKWARTRKQDAAIQRKKSYYES